MSWMVFRYSNRRLIIEILVKLITRLDNCHSVELCEFSSVDKVFQFFTIFVTQRQQWCRKLSSSVMDVNRDWVETWDWNERKVVTCDKPWRVWVGNNSTKNIFNRITICVNSHTSQSCQRIKIVLFSCFLSERNVLMSCIVNWEYSQSFPFTLSTPHFIAFRRQLNRMESHLDNESSRVSIVHFEHQINIYSFIWHIWADNNKVYSLKLNQEKFCIKKIL